MSADFAVFVQISHMSGFVDLRVSAESGFVRGWELNLSKQLQFFSIIADEPAFKSILVKVFS